MRLNFFFLLSSLFSYSQDFYVNTVNNAQLDNKVFLLNTINSSTQEQSICPPTNNTNQYFENVYTDIAIDFQNNLYYTSAWGSLYKKTNNDESCQFLGGFPLATTINSLVVDSNNFIYASGLSNGDTVGTIFKYDINTNIFSTLGNLPNNYIPSGDLFFYESRLFLTCINTTNSDSFILEINMQNTQESCYFMSLNNLVVYGAFSLYNNDTSSNSYVITAWTEDSPYSSLIEINMDNQAIEGPIRNYDFRVYGATAYYGLTSTSSICESMGVSDFSESHYYFNFINPSSINLQFDTNIEINKIIKISVFNISGQKVMTYQNIQSNNLDVSKFKEGVYITQIEIDNNDLITKKIIIQ